MSRCEKHSLKSRDKCATIPLLPLAAPMHCTSNLSYASNGGLCSRGKYFPRAFRKGGTCDFTGVCFNGVIGALRRLQLRAEAPLGAGVGDVETPALGIPLGIAARRGPHHCEIASMFESVTHAFVKQRGLQAAPAQLRNSRRAAKQRHSVADAERARGARLGAPRGRERIVRCPRSNPQS